MVGRKIIHVDMDAFYASVEQRDNPALKGKPLIVGGSPEHRGVVASCSYEARKFGIRSAMSTRRAYGLCPNAMLVRPRMERYKEVSREIRAIFLSATDLVEPLSLDEAYLDVTSNKFNEPSATRIAQRIREEIRTKLNLTASAGVGPNKFIAKVASDIRKPNGLFVIPPQKAREFIEKLPIERFWGVGPATAKKLKERGIHTGADLGAQTPATLHSWLGRFGLFLHGLSQGEDSRQVRTDREPKSRGSETTFNDDVTSLPELEKTIGELSDDVAESLKRLGRGSRTVVLKVKYADFSLVTRTRTLGEETSDRELIARTACDLLRTSTDAGQTPIRLLGVSVKLASSEAPDRDGAQLDFGI